MPTTKRYLIDLLERAGTVFATTLAGVAVAAQPFNVLTFHWDTALTTAGSAAVLAVLVGLGAGRSGDPGNAGFTK